ncbi:helix-turn-helix domain-containing protein [Acidovorax cavernicola]|uniref:Helix-turn-helix domain-containing protein n=2 Tax=Acidovorax cavernicola TaxID=1675792 RepID=A0A9X8D836_9BURK|nr:helix-turn-helix domain-containing protein [Acidovorax cavernicola]
MAAAPARTMTELLHFTRKLTAEAQAQASGVGAWDQHYEQLSNGRFEGLAEDLHLDFVQVFHERANQTVLQRGRGRPGAIAFALTDASAPGSWYCGHDLGGRQLSALPPQGEFELLAGAGMDLMAVCVDTEPLANLAATLFGPDFELRMPVPAPVQHPGFDETAFTRLLGAALSLARDNLAQLEQPAARHMLSLSLADAVLHCLGSDAFEARLPASTAARRHIVAKAREYMQAHADEPISVPDLCVATGVSRRSLQYAFEDVLHLSPVTYLRVMRLNRVRCEMQACREDTIGDIAARWGFWHLSRFAIDYARLFGELPSATRARWFAKS